MFDTFFYRDGADPDAIMVLALQLAAEGSSSDSDRDEETLRDATRKLLDAFLILKEDTETLDEERAILDLYQATYKATYKFPCDAYNLWWNEYLPQTNLPKHFVVTVARIEAGRDRAMCRMLQQMSQEAHP